MDTSKLIAEIMQGIAAISTEGDWYLDDDRYAVRVEGNTICVEGPEDEDGNIEVRRFRLVEIDK